VVVVVVIVVIAQKARDARVGHERGVRAAARHKVGVEEQHLT